MTLRIAMWSGPRNISTALMRSFGSRADTVVCDEPLYGHYLKETGLEHPMAAEVMAQHECDWQAVASWLTGPLAPDIRSERGQIPGVFYQKHMAHHLLPSIDRGWLDSLQHAFLIRPPRPMLRSLLQVLPQPRLEDTGLPQQVELFASIAQRGAAPPVIDSEELLRDPQNILKQLCARLGIDFDEGMLAWQQGPRATDGAWAPAWYANVERTTGFLPYQPASAEIPPPFESLAKECESLYAILQPHALRIQAPA